MADHRTSLFRSTSPEMDARIWCRLPEHLLEHVLSFLPLKAFLSLQSTCKHFNSLIFSPSFISKHSSSSSSSASSSDSNLDSFLLLSHPQFRHRYRLFDTKLNKWRRQSICLSSRLSSMPSATYLVSISRGLLCFSTASSFLVCSLLSRSSRIVNFPETPSPSAFDFITLVSSPNGLSLFLLSPTSAFLYNSRLHQWNRFDRVDSVLADSYHQEGVFFNGKLYFTTTEPFSIVGFDLETGKWERETIELPEELTFVRLMSNGGEKLYLVGGIGQNGISRSLKLWELSRNWVEVVTVPEMMCRKFMSVCYHNYEHVYCFWHQGLVCVCCYNWPEILYYKVSRGTWHWLPKCPALPERCSLGFRWFCLVPQLHASV